MFFQAKNYFLKCFSENQTFPGHFSNILFSTIIYSLLTPRRNFSLDSISFVQEGIFVHYVDSQSKPSPKQPTKIWDTKTYTSNDNTQVLLSLRFLLLILLHHYYVVVTFLVRVPIQK